MAMETPLISFDAIANSRLYARQTLMKNADYFAFYGDCIAQATVRGDIRFIRKRFETQPKHPISMRELLFSMEAAAILDYTLIFELLFRKLCVDSPEGFGYSNYDPQYTKFLFAAVTHGSYQMLNLLLTSGRVFRNQCVSWPFSIDLLIAATLWNVDLAALKIIQRACAERSKKSPRNHTGLELEWNDGWIRAINQRECMANFELLLDTVPHPDWFLYKALRAETMNKSTLATYMQWVLRQIQAKAAMRLKTVGISSMECSARLGKRKLPYQEAGQEKRRRMEAEAAPATGILFKQLDVSTQQYLLAVLRDMCSTYYSGATQVLLIRSFPGLSQAFLSNKEQINTIVEELRLLETWKFLVDFKATWIQEAQDIEMMDPFGHIQPMRYSTLDIVQRWRQKKYLIDACLTEELIISPEEIPTPLVDDVTILCDMVRDCHYLLDQAFYFDQICSSVAVLKSADSNIHTLIYDYTGGDFAQTKWIAGFSRKGIVRLLKRTNGLIARIAAHGGAQSWRRLTP